MHYTDIQKEEAKNTDMIIFLGTIEGYHFKKVGSEYHSIEHDSLVIKSDRRTWFWNSQGLRGKNAVDWCITIHNMNYRDSMQLLVGAPVGNSIFKKKYNYIKKAPIDIGALNYVKISNRLLDLELSNAELSVIVYLATIHSNVVSKSGTTWIRVKQSTIAQKCNIKSVQTISRVISSLATRGLVKVARVTKDDNKLGTTCYSLSLPSIAEGYFPIDRRVFRQGLLSPRQLRVYLYICRCIDSNIGYCWNSYNDLAKLISMKRSDVIDIVSELIRMRYIHKQRIKRRDNRRVFADNRYSLIVYVLPSLYRRNKKIEAALSNSQITQKILIALYAMNYNGKNNTCQVFLNKIAEGKLFKLSRGSP